MDWLPTLLLEMPSYNGWLKIIEHKLFFWVSLEHSGIKCNFGNFLWEHFCRYFSKKSLVPSGVITLKSAIQVWDSSLLTIVCINIWSTMEVDNNWNISLSACKLAHILRAIIYLTTNYALFKGYVTMPG